MFLAVVVVYFLCLLAVWFDWVCIVYADDTVVGRSLWYSRITTGTLVGGIMPTSLMTIATNSIGVRSYTRFSTRK
jgi:hypothetical protein